jgi:hypothetical protein
MCVYAYVAVGGIWHCHVSKCVAHDAVWARWLDDGKTSVGAEGWLISS